MTGKNHAAQSLQRISELETVVSNLRNELNDLNTLLKKEQEQRQFYQLIADFTFGWELWFNQTGTVNYCSPSCYDLTGYTANQVMMAASLSELLVYNSDQEKFDDFVSRSINQVLVNSSLEFRIVTRTRQIRWCLMNARGVYNLQGHYQGVRASVNDITRLKGALGHISGLSVGRELESRNRQRLQSELEIKERELVAFLIQLSQKNERITFVRKQLEGITNEPAGILKEKLTQVLQYLNHEPSEAINWDMIEVQLEKLQPGFMERLVLKHPRLTVRDKKLCACLRLGLTSKEVAGLNNLAPQSVEIARVRLRKKLKLPHEIRLVSYLMKI